MRSVKFYALEADLKKRGVADSEIIEGVSKLNIDDLANTGERSNTGVLRWQ